MSALVMTPVGAGRAPRVAVRPAPRPARPAAAAVRPATTATSGAAPRRADGGGALHLTTRGRVLLIVLALLAVVVGAVTTQTGRAVADGGRSATTVERHVVQPGETLWGIASAVAEPGDDVRDVVLELVELNRLPSAGLMAGQTIVVPVG